jgi:transposase
MVGRWKTARGLDARGVFPPEEVAAVKAEACARPNAAGRPLGRLSVFDVCRKVWDNEVTTMSYSTVWRRLHEDLLRPWFQRGWIFPRDPQFLPKATPVLELYQRLWQGEPLGPRDVVLSADEMPGIQALQRIHPSLPAGPDRQTRQEFEYKRLGTLCYHAFLNVQTGKVYGQVHPSTGIEPFQQTLTGLLQEAEYQTAERIFLILDNGGSHHPNTSPARLAALDARVTAVHLPTHASWLNQIEIYFSVLARKGIGKADFHCLGELRDRILRFTCYYNQLACPFAWKFTPQKLKEYLAKLATKSCEYADQLARLGLGPDGQQRNDDHGDDAGMSIDLSCGSLVIPASA